MFNLETIGTNSFEPVTLDDVKKHSRIYIAADDDYISTLIVAARMQVETDLNSKIVDQEYHLHLKHWLHCRFPFLNVWNEYGFGFVHHHDWHGIDIPVVPARSITSITYTDTDGNPQTYDPSNYIAELWKDPPHIHLIGDLPGIQEHTDIIVDFEAGYATADDVPQLVKQAILFLAAHWYETREAVSSAMTEVPLSYERIIQTLKVRRLV